MDEFDNMFSDVTDEVASVPESNNNQQQSYTQQNNQNYNNNSNGYKNNNYGGYKKGNYDNKPKYKNVEGKQTINIWNGDRVQPLELDMQALKTNEKWVTFVIANMFYKLDEQEEAKIKELATTLKEKGFKARVVCGYVKPIFKILKEVFGDDLMLITAWKGYCKELKDVKQYLSTDANIKAAAYYYSTDRKNYNDLPNGIKLTKSAAMGSLVGPDNNELSQFVIVHDRNYDGRRLDFKQSQNTSDYVFLAKKLSLNMFNIAMDKQYNDLKSVLG